jgi:hypothetical protein
MSTDAESNRQPTEPAALPTPAKPIAEVLARKDGDPPLSIDESAAALEARLQKETDGRQEDRWYAIAIGTVLADMAVFQHLPWIGIICIFLLELVILLGLARRLGNEHATILLDYLFHQFCARIGLGKD